MSFLSGLESVGKYILKGSLVATKVIGPAEPLIAMIPGVGTIATTVINAIGTLENLVPQDGAGAAKKTAIIAIINAIHPGLDQVKLSADIDEIVKVLNMLSGILGGMPQVAPQVVTK